MITMTARDLAIGYRPSAGWRGGSGASLYTMAAVDPTALDDVDDGYRVGSRWINTVSDDEFVCLDNTAGIAIWTSTTTGGGGGGSIAVKDEGTTIVGSATALNFIGSNVVVTSGGGGQANVTITGNSYFPSGF